MKAGTAKVMITPPVGHELSGWSFGPSVDIHDNLFAKVMVLESLGKKTVIVTTDLIGFGTSYADRIRRMIASRLDIDLKYILVSCSHTHSGPATIKLRQWGAVDEFYVETVINHIIGAVDIAIRRMDEAFIGTGEGEVRGVGINRRDMEKGLVDNQLQVIRIDNGEGKMKAALMNYSCHPVAAHDYMNVISADYPGYAMRVLESLKNDKMIAMFSTGAAGDINPVHFHHIKYAEKYGYMVGGEALKIAEAIECESRLDISAAAKTAKLPTKKLPSVAELNAIIEEQKKIIKSQENEKSVDPHKFAEELIRLEWAEEALKIKRAGIEADSVEIAVNVLRLNDTALVGIPGEVFVEIGLNIKKSSPLRHTLILELTNGALCYLPTKSAFDKGGYELDMASKVYGLYLLTDEVQGIVEKTANDLLRSV
jgi:neutral ceramidase